MLELIWFSIPGAVFIFAAYSLWPAVADSEPILLIILVPIAGFVIHQSFRLLFEIYGGYSRKSRDALIYIQGLVNEKHKMQIDIKQAFIIWELAFYSDKISSSFRDHDRGAWHYILSFWSVSFSALLSSVMILWVSNLDSIHLLYVFVFELFIAVMFFYKANLTHRSLLLQEKAIVQLDNDAFLDVAEKILDVDLV